MTASFIGTALSASGPVSYRGFIDVIDSTQGVRGWALDLERLSEPVALQLMVGDLVAAETSPDLIRHDIAEALGEPVAPGFAFDAAALARATELADSTEDQIAVRIAGSDLLLAYAGPLPTVDDIIQQLRQQSAPEPALASTADLELLLDDLRANASALAEQALKPLPENLQGYIETLAIDTSGQVWMVGWMRRGHLTEFAAVISERRKIPAAVAVMTYSRDDLPADACGVIGLISSTWRPTSTTSEFYMFFGGGGRFHLRANVPLRLITPTELVAEYEQVRERSLGEGRAIALQRMLTSLENWLPTRSTAQAYATETSIDRVLLVPGLGCLVEGWVISPMKRVDGLRLRIGGAIMTAAPEATYWKPRPDLLSAFPGSEALVRRAGFVGLFAGDAEPDDFAEPVFKVVFQGGTTANWAVPPKVFRRLGHSAKLEDALQFFPALLEEYFFPRFADAAIRAQRTAINPPVPMHVMQTRRALVAVLPEDRCDLFLQFEELHHHCQPGSGIDGVAFVASNNRSDALWMFREFQRHHDLPCSLLAIDEAAHAFTLLPDILRAIGANRFLFLGPGVFLTDLGWRHAGQVLRGVGPDLVFFGLESENFELREAADAVSARAFAWTTAQFLRWSLSAAPFLGGFHRENGLFRSNVAHVVHHGAARCSRTTLPPRIQEAVNNAVYTSGLEGVSVGARM